MTQLAVAEPAQNHGPVLSPDVAPCFPGGAGDWGPGIWIRGEERCQLAVQGACQLRSHPSPLSQDIVPVLAGPSSLVEVGFLGSVPVH